MAAMNGALADFGRNWRRLAGFSGLGEGRARAIIVNIVVVAAFGVAIPWRKGFDFFDAFILFAYSLIPLLYAIPAVSDLLGGASGCDSTAITAKATAAAAYSWTMLLIIDGLAIATVNALYRVRFLHPDWRLLGSAILFGFAVSLLTASLTAVIAVLFSPTAARSGMRLFVLAVLALLLVSNRWMPPSWQAWLARRYTATSLARFGLAASAVMLIFSAGLLFALSQRPRETFAASDRR